MPSSGPVGSVSHCDSISTYRGAGQISGTLLFFRVRRASEYISKYSTSRDPFKFGILSPKARAAVATTSPLPFESAGQTEHAG